MMTQTTHHPDQLKALDAALNSLHKQYGLSLIHISEPTRPY